MSPISQKNRIAPASNVMMRNDGVGTGRRSGTARIRKVSCGSLVVSMPAPEIAVPLTRGVHRHGDYRRDRNLARWPPVHTIALHRNWLRGICTISVNANAG
jgi:hypothetical protein